MATQKIFLSFSMMIALLSAGTIENEIGVNLGVTSINNEEGAEFKNLGISATYQMNRYVVSPRFDIDYVKIDDYGSVSGLLKASVNGVYEFDTDIATLNPYLLFGVGYERVNNDVDDVFDSNAFIQGGAGIAYSISETESRVRFESKVLQVLGAEDQDNEMILNVGMMMPISGSSKEKKVSSYAKASRKPVVIQKRVPVYVDRNKCPKKIDGPDRDRDGVIDFKDQCPATPCGFTVDLYGCPVKTTLKINFQTGSARIELYSLHRVLDFANFLLSNKGSLVQIIGHTDSVGSSASNITLSQRRAEAVANKLVELGVSPSRITAIGMGESSPIASNSTIEGRRQNRRIEAVLSYPTRR